MVGVTEREGGREGGDNTSHCYVRVCVYTQDMYACVCVCTHACVCTVYTVCVCLTQDVEVEVFAAVPCAVGGQTGVPARVTHLGAPHLQEASV